MNTLTIFPSLLDYMLLSPLILRLAVSIFILSLGYDRLNKNFGWALVLYLATSVLLILGLYTQVASILGILTLKLDIYSNYWSKRAEEKIPRNIYILYGLAGIVLISLLFTGPGFWAIDLPF